MKNQQGFTVIELMIVVAIIGILAGIIVPTYTRLPDAQNTTTDTKVQTSSDIIQQHLKNSDRSSTEVKLKQHTDGKLYACTVGYLKLSTMMELIVLSVVIILITVVGGVLIEMVFGFDFSVNSYIFVICIAIALMVFNAGRSDDDNSDAEEQVVTLTESQQLKQELAEITQELTTIRDTLVSNQQEDSSNDSTSTKNSTTNQKTDNDSYNTMLVLGTMVLFFVLVFWSENAIGALFTIWVVWMVFDIEMKPDVTTTVTKVTPIAHEANGWYETKHISNSIRSKRPIYLFKQNDVIYVSFDQNNDNDRFDDPQLINHTNGQIYACINIPIVCYPITQQKTKI